MYFELNEKPPFSDQTIEICSIMRETSSYIFILEIDFVIEKLQLRETNRDELSNSTRTGKILYIKIYIKNAILLTLLK